MTDTDQFSDQQILALTLLGESENLGERAMQGTALTIINRVALNVHWIGGSDVRAVCLCPAQYQCWSPSADRARVMRIATEAPSYAPYVAATAIAGQVLAGALADFTNNATYYFDPPSRPAWAFYEDGTPKLPCFIDTARRYYNFQTVNGASNR